MPERRTPQVPAGESPRRFAIRACIALLLLAAPLVHPTTHRAAPATARLAETSVGGPGELCPPGDLPSPVEAGRPAASPTGAAADDGSRSTLPAGPSRDLYCLPLVAAPGIDDRVEGVVELGRVPSPFGATVTPDGRLRYDLTLRLRGLPPPSTLGDYSTYVAWITTPVLHPMERLGDVGNGDHRVGPTSREKFLVLVSAERSADVARRQGALVLRGQSPSLRMRPPDFLEFTLGAAGTTGGGPGGHARPGRADADAGDANGHGDGHGGAAASGASSWTTPPMPPRISMLPALMELRPRVAPFLPEPPAGERGVPDARPRRTVRLADGDTLRLEAGPVRREIGDRTFTMYGYNGQYPGPLLEVSRGATIFVEFRNAIGLPSTVHWHGVRLDNRFDGVPHVTQQPVAPGESFLYRVHFRDAGIYWYHPHLREDVQQDLGLYGNILVRPPGDDYWSPVNREEVLMLDDLLVGEAGLVPWGRGAATHTMMGRFGNVFLVNGARDWSAAVDRGSVVRFFLTNVSNTRTFNLSLPGARMKVVGADIGNFEHEEWVESVVIGPAQRYVAHARFDEPGVVPLVNRVRGLDHLYGRFFQQADTLGRVRVRETPARPDLADSFRRLRRDRSARREIERYREHFDRPPDHTMVLTLETRELPLAVERLMRLDSAYFHPVEWSGTMPMMNWASDPGQVEWKLIDRATGRENMAIDWRFRVGDVVKIRLVNDRSALHAMQHPIHIHGQRFLVLSRNGVPEENLVWKDTILLPVGTTAEILLELSNPGEWMIHCHISEHIESGMRATFQVDPANADRDRRRE